MTWPAAHSITKAIGSGCGAYCFQVTMFLMTFMSIERWLHMTRRSFITVHRTRVTLVVLLLISIPLAWALVEKPVSYHFSVAIILIVWVVCLTLTLAAYFKVLRTICRHQQQIHAIELQQNFPQPAINLEKYRKSVFTILYILAAFYICFLPIAIAMALALVHPTWINSLSYFSPSQQYLCIYILCLILSCICGKWMISEMKSGNWLRTCFVKGLKFVDCHKPRRQWQRERHQGKRFTEKYNGYSRALKTGYSS